MTDRKAIDPDWGNSSLYEVDIVQESKPFHIVHLSDLHLTARENDKRTELGVFSPLRGMNASFRQLLASPVIRKADHIIITGDVTDRGDLDAWQLFWSAVEAAGISEKLSIIPGNHDVCCLGARLPLKTRMYRREDLQKTIAGLAIGSQPTKFPWAISPDPRVVIFGLNSNNLGNLNVATNAMGELGYYQLQSLASKMHVYRHVPVKIVALHHSPNIPGPETAIRRNQRPFSQLDRIGFQIPRDQRRALFLLCIAHRIRLVIHGHLHMTEDRKVNGIRVIGVPSSTEPVMKNHVNSVYQFYRYTVQGDGGRVRCEVMTIRGEP